jgi:hypothetical protein
MPVVTNGLPMHLVAGWIISGLWIDFGHEARGHPPQRPGDDRPAVAALCWGRGSLCLAAFGAGAAALKGSPAVASSLGMTPPDDFAMALGGCRSC